jgi:predicted phage terminase large subunit-like protein
MPIERAPTIEDVETEKARRHLSEFVRQMWKAVLPGVPLQWNWHLDVLCEHLEAVTRRDIRRLIINVPPRTLKSTVVSVAWPVWTWIQADPEKPKESLAWWRWLFTSYAEKLAVRDALTSRRLIQHPWFQARWGDKFSLTSDMNTKGYYDNDKHGHRIAVGLLGGATGEGGEAVVADDPHNVEEGESVDVRQKTLLTWDEVFSTRVNDARTGVFVVIMQRVHSDDLTGHLLEQGGWHHLCLPMHYRPSVYLPGTKEPNPRLPQPHKGCQHGSDPREEEGALLFPERFDEETLADLTKRLGAYAASAQLDQNPVPREGAIINVENIRPLPDAFDVPDGKGRTLRSLLRKVQYWDLAFSEKQMADYTTAATKGVDSADNHYLLDMFRERIDEGSLAEKIAAHIVLTKPDVVGLEIGAFRQKATLALIREVNRLLSKAHVAVTVLGVRVDKDKVTRARIPAERAKVGMEYGDKTARWWQTFEAEATPFPTAQHDDQVDAWSGATILAIEGGVPVSADDPDANNRARAYGWAGGPTDEDEFDPFEESKELRLDPDGYYR